MATNYTHPDGKVDEIELLNLFEPQAGEITQRFGRIGSGKTYGATVDVLDELARGHVVYVNWKFNFNGYDQRESLFHVFASLLFPWKKRFYNFPKDNLKYIEIDEQFIDKFSLLTDCSVYLDEGHVVFDSYEMAKMSMKKRTAVLHTRHFDRSINIISQRPTAVHVTMRANVNRFYKYEKLMSTPFLIFRRTEYQDMIDETVDEEKPLSVKLYLGKKRIYSMYDSKYLRGNLQSSQTVKFEAYDIPYYKRVSRFFRLLWRAFTRA